MHTSMLVNLACWASYILTLSSLSGK
jgi:hypothetical protein